MNDVARRVLLRRNPRGMPVADDFEVAEEPMPEPGAGDPDTIGNSVRRRMEGILSGQHPPLRSPG